MKARNLALLAFLGLAVALAVASRQPFPGYMDSDYYFGGGLRLAGGHGFTEPYIWNYLDDPQGLPHPSHSYWMPLASILAAAGMWVAQHFTYSAGRLPFIALAALAPIVTALLAYSFSRRSDLAMTSGLLAVFSGYYAPFLPVTDNYGPYLVLGGLFFLMLRLRTAWASIALGVVAGLMALARTDGLLWIGLAIAATLATPFLRALPSAGGPSSGTLEAGAASRVRDALLHGLIVIAAFVAVMGPWFYRTYLLYGTLLAPGGSKLLWLRNYDETFLYPAAQLTFGRWLAQGWPAILSARVRALEWNLLNAFAAQAELFLAPFIVVGLWIHRRDLRVIVACIAWIALLLVMTLVFPFAGSRGGFFHSGAALQGLCWALSPVGLDAAISAARRRHWFTPQANAVFRAALVGVAVLMTATVIWLRVLPGWGEGERDYPELERYLVQSGIQPGEAVMVRNPPGYFVMTGRPAVVVPYGGSAVVREVAARYQVRYVLIEAAGAAGPIASVYQDLQDPNLRFLGQIHGTRLFRIVP